MEFIKPPVCHWAMCVYKLTLDNGFYYYGATTDLAERVYLHIKNYKTGKQSQKMKEAFETATTATFEFVEFANDRTMLTRKELFYLKNHVGLPLCMNMNSHGTISFVKGEAENRVALVNDNNEVLKVYNNKTDAAIDLKISVQSVRQRAMAKYAKTNGVFVREVNEKGEVISPLKPYCDSKKKWRPVNQFDLNMNFIKHYESVCAAERECKINNRSIFAVLNNRHKTTHGFIFKYAEAV